MVMEKIKIMQIIAYVIMVVSIVYGVRGLRADTSKTFFLYEGLCNTFSACRCHKNSDVRRPHAGNYSTESDTDGTGELVLHSDRSLFRYYRIL